VSLPVFSTQVKNITFRKWCFVSFRLVSPAAESITGGEVPILPQFGPLGQPPNPVALALPVGCALKPWLSATLLSLRDYHSEAPQELLGLSS
jgi:hypothetical protein